MKLMLLSTTLLFAACAATPGTKPSSTTTGPMIAANDPFPAAKSGLKLAGDKEQGLTLDSVLAQFESATGVHVVTTAEVENMLMKTAVRMSAPLDVPANRVYPTVETLLAQNGFVITLLTSQAPVMVGIEPAEGGKVLNRTWVVGPDDLSFAAEHPALLVSTVVTLPNTNIRDLSNSLRQMFQDPRTQQVIPVGQSNSLLLVGRGNDIAGLVRMLKAVDEEEGRARPASSMPDAHIAPAKKDDSAPK